jgi:hypothetical protein
VFHFSDSAEERSSELCFVSVSVQKRGRPWVDINPLVQLKYIIKQSIL